MNWYNFLRNFDLNAFLLLSFFGLVSFWGLVMGVVVNYYLGTDLVFENSMRLLVLLASLLPYNVVGFYCTIFLTKEKKEEGE